MDNSALIIALTGYVIVFSALFVLWLIFAFLPRLLTFHIKIKFKKHKNETACDKCGEFITGQENAVIAAAVYLYLSELHDEESMTMTIKKVKKDYSPWSSRVYTINAFQRR
ncbi:MAG: OadG family protein [Chlorobi bacterium]|nr:OadG family protein [Chlorobiota bacterium]